jgi:hypothetical protein
MGFVPDWNRQNMKKTGASGPTTTPSRKDCGPLFHSAPAPQSKSMAKPLRLADGDTEESYKARGLEASKGESVGFFERMRMGNIDQAGSEAYNRFGAGRAALDTMASDAEDIRSANRSAASAATKPTESARVSDPDLGAFNEAGSGDNTPAYPLGSETSRSVTTSPAQSRPRATSSVSGSARDNEAGMSRGSRSASSASSPSVRNTAPDESSAESSRLGRMNASLAVANAVRPNRAPVRTAAPATSSRGQDRILRDVTPGEVDPKTLLPKR